MALRTTTSASTSTTGNIVRARRETRELDDALTAARAAHEAAQAAHALALAQLEKRRVELERRRERAAPMIADTQARRARAEKRALDEAAATAGRAEDVSELEAHRAALERECASLAAQVRDLRPFAAYLAEVCDAKADESVPNGPVLIDRYASLAATHDDLAREATALEATLESEKRAGEATTRDAARRAGSREAALYGLKQRLDALRAEADTLEAGADDAERARGGRIAALGAALRAADNMFSRCALSAPGERIWHQPGDAEVLGFLREPERGGGGTRGAADDDDGALRRAQQPALLRTRVEKLHAVASFLVDFQAVADGWPTWVAARAAAAAEAEAAAAQEEAGVLANVQRAAADPPGRPARGHHGAAAGAAALNAPSVVSALSASIEAGAAQMQSSAAGGFAGAASQSHGAVASPDAHPLAASPTRGAGGFGSPGSGAPLGASTRGSAAIGAGGGGGGGRGHQVSGAFVDRAGTMYYVVKGAVLTPEVIASIRRTLGIAPPGRGLGAVAGRGAAALAGLPVTTAGRGSSDDGGRAAVSASGLAGGASATAQASDVAARPADTP